MFRPDFIKNNEDWIVWLMAEEFHQSASPVMLTERTRLSDDQVEEAVRNLERIKAITVMRDRGSIKSVRLLNRGKTRYSELKGE